MNSYDNWYIRFIQGNNYQCVRQLWEESLSVQIIVGSLSLVTMVTRDYIVYTIYQVTGYTIW